MRKIAEFFIKDKLIVNLIIIVIFVAGILSLKEINREVFPQTELPHMNVRISYPGASAEDVELNAVIPVEDSIMNISGISDFRSFIMDGGAFIWMELDEDISDIQSVKDEVYRTISLSNISGISEDVTSLRVNEFNPSRRRVYQFALKPKSESTSYKELLEMSKVVEDLLKKVDNVSEVLRRGARDRQIYIDVDPEKLEEAYVSISDVISSIQTRNVRSSSGTLQSIEQDLNILTVGEFEDPMEVGNVIIRSGFEQKSIRVKDIADVIDGYEDSDTKIRANGANTIIFGIRKKETADIVETVENIEKFLEENSDIYGQKFEVDTLENSAESIESLLRVVIQNAFLGFILVIIILFVFLDLRTSFWTALSIPICILISAIFMNLAGITLNVITIGAIITVLGMLVDDGIVIAEIIYQKKEQGMAPKLAAINGVTEIIKPVAITIFSTILAFLPMLYISGRMGSFIKVFPVVISIMLLASLLEAGTLLPAHLAHAGTKATTEKQWFIKLRENYKNFLTKCIKLRYLVLIIFISLLLFSLWLGSKDMKRFRLYNSSTSEEIALTMEVTSGSSLDQTEEYVKIFEKKINEIIKPGELVSVISTIGENTESRTADKLENLASIEIKLVPTTKRKRITKMIIRELQKDLNKDNYDFLENIKIAEHRRGPSAGDAVDIKIVTDNKKNSEAVMALVEGKLSAIKGVKDIGNDYTKGKDEIRIKFHYTKLAQYGFTVKSVASTVRAAFAGSSATSIQTTEDKLDFYVRIKDEYKKDRKFLLNLLVPNRSGNLVRLGEIAYLDTEKGPTLIRHFNGERALSVTAGVDEKVITSLEVNKRLKKELKNVSTDYPGTYLMYEGEFRHTNTAIKDLAIAFGGALVLIYLIVLILFRSAGQPLVILSVIPFGLIGVLISLKLHGLRLDFMGIIGIIGLSGVVVNDSIIMVDFINKVRKSGKKKKDDILQKIAEGASFRLRPIIITTATTVVGLMPTIYLSGDVSTFRTTVVAMAYGLLFATMLTLIFVPSLYMIGLDIQSILKRIFEKYKYKTT